MGRAADPAAIIRVSVATPYAPSIPKGWGSITHPPLTHLWLRRTPRLDNDGCGILYDIFEPTTAATV